MKFFNFLVFLGVISFVYLSYVFPRITIPAQTFIVNRGDTVASLPEKVGLNVNATVYKAYLHFFVPSMVLQAGTYTIEKPVTLKSFFATTLKNPTSKDLTITILPGWNIWDIDAYLAREGVIKSGEFTHASENISPKLKTAYPFLGKATTLEGFLVPDTYRISPSASTQDIIDMLFRVFDTRVYKEFNFASDKDLYNTIIFASILEKEEKSSVNKPIVAGILKKRFAEGIAIGADATVCYGYRLTMNDCTPVFIGDHIYEKNPYNTRATIKMIPSPISNPSIETIRATIASEESKYYYYLHDDNGFIHYGKNLEEHNKNRVLYLGK